MAESASKILNSFTEFCRERSDILMIAGAALVVLIILVAIFKSVAKKDDDDEDFDFDEEAFQAEGKALTEGKAQAENKALTESKVLSEKKINETVKGDKIESLLEQIAGIPTKNLEEVEIKIQGAELKFKYSKNEFRTMEASAPELAESPPDAESKEGSEELQAAENTARHDEIKKEDGSHDAEDEKKDDVGEKGEKIVIKKFGPDNVDTSRSGRVFTEDELEEKIRD